MSHTENATLTASERWVQIRTAAGYSSDRALERAAELTQSSISAWTTTKDYGRGPTVGNYRRIAKLLGIGLDLLDELIRGMLDEKARAAQ